MPKPQLSPEQAKLLLHIIEQTHKNTSVKEIWGDRFGDEEVEAALAALQVLTVRTKIESVTLTARRLNALLAIFLTGEKDMHHTTRRSLENGGWIDDDADLTAKGHDVVVVICYGARYTAGALSYIGKPNHSVNWEAMMRLAHRSPPFDKIRIYDQIELAKVFAKLQVLRAPVESGSSGPTLVPEPS